MGDAGLAHLWTERLTSQGWSQHAAELYSGRWALSTQKTYDRLFSDFKEFLSKKGICILEAREVHLADFLTEMARRLMHPKTTLHGIVAAVSHGCAALGLKSPVSPKIHELVHALVKCETQVPLSHSGILSVSAFRRLFHH